MYDVLFNRLHVWYLIRALVFVMKPTGDGNGKGFH